MEITKKRIQVKSFIFIIPLLYGMNKGELIYLASPYSHSDPAVKESRFRDVCKVAARLMAEGYYIFSPIAHTHPIALAGSLPGDWQYWAGYDREIIKNCKFVLVFRLNGWEESAGVQAEIKLAKELGIPIEYLD
jgi:hypothetical protein